MLTQQSSLEIEFVPIEIFFNQNQSPHKYLKSELIEKWHALHSNTTGDYQWSFSISNKQVMIPLLPILTDKHEIMDIVAQALRMVERVPPIAKKTCVLIGTPLFDVATDQGPLYQFYLGLAYKE